MRKASFPRSARLCKKEQFQQVKQRGKTVSCHLFVLNALVDSELMGPQIGIISAQE
jgi:RNase P protein component